METFQQIKCCVCDTDGETPASRRLSCCGKFIHDGCLLDSFDHPFGNQQHNCPHCRTRLFLLNNGEELPSHIPEGCPVLRLSYSVQEVRSTMSTRSTTAAESEVMSKRKKRHVNRRRKQKERRMAALLQTKCNICRTPRETPFRQLPCCNVCIHERCLIDGFGPDQHNCPHCGMKLYLLNEGEESPIQIPEGCQVFRFQHIRYEKESILSTGATPGSEDTEEVLVHNAGLTLEAAPESEVMPKKKKRRLNRKRKQKERRMAAFLQTKCSVCHTPRETPSRQLPCCNVCIHERCLIDGFAPDEHDCPCCGVKLILLNDDEESPSVTPEGCHVFQFQHIRYASKVQAMGTTQGTTAP